MLHRTGSEIGTRIFSIASVLPLYRWQFEQRAGAWTFSPAIIVGDAHDGRGLASVGAATGCGVGTNFV